MSGNRKQGHSALKIEGGKLVTFDPHPDKRTSGDKTEIEGIRERFEFDKVNLSEISGEDVERMFTEIENLKTQLRSICPHKKTHSEDWPDGGAIEVCDDCGMSRYIWGQGE